jgi:membrane fusion protein, copper/silver efflux system
MKTMKGNFKKMKNINRPTLLIALSTLILGLFFGWLFFSEGKIDQEEHNHSLANGSEVWTCSMHPQIRQGEPGSCPICGMDLIPVDMGDSDDDNPMEVKMSPTAMQLANVQTAIIEKGKATKELRLSGKIQVNESSVSTQTAHISGRVEKLYINTTGEYVSKGKVIAEIYSPELVTAQEELFEAQKMKAMQPQLFAASKERLRNWKLSDSQIENILLTGKPQERFPILSDINGVVINKKIQLGDYINRGSSLFELANLSQVWVLFDVYESDLTWIKTGDPIEYTIQAFPGQKFKGKISFIDPFINPTTRVAKARVVSANPGNKLKPEMFVTGMLLSQVKGSQSDIVVPKSAVMWTGERSVVYVKSLNEQSISFAMRVVTLGPSLGDSYIITEGLKYGEEIVTYGAFSIDAAAQLAGKPSMMNPEGGKAMTGHNHGEMK